MDAVLPQQYGIRKHPLFCLRALFRRCCGCCSSQGGRYGVSRQLLSKATRQARTSGGGTQGTTEQAGQAASQDVAAATTSSGNTPLLHPDSLLTAHNGTYCAQPMLWGRARLPWEEGTHTASCRFRRRGCGKGAHPCARHGAKFRVHTTRWVAGWGRPADWTPARVGSQKRHTHPRSCCVLCMQVCPSTTQPMTIQSSFVDSTSALLASAAPRR